MSYKVNIKSLLSEKATLVINNNYNEYHIKFQFIISLHKNL